MELWLIFAGFAAVFAAATTILAKIGIKDVDSHLATAIRTAVVVVFAWIMVFVVGAQGGIFYIAAHTWFFIVISGLATGAAWLFRFRALKLGDVNKVMPLDKSSTILTMILAFIFLSEPVGWITAGGMILMAFGTFLMLARQARSENRGHVSEAARSLEAESGLLTDEKKPAKKSWLFYAVFAAIFASLVAIFGRVGVADIDATLWTALRTMVVLPLACGMTLGTGRGERVREKLRSVTRKSWIFLVLSGIATGASWLFFYHALKLGNASHVVPIDKLSIVLTMAFAGIFLREKFSLRSIFGLVLLTAGTLLTVYPASV
ncbi:MAG: EamA family transporter [Defluviitaleaceae bacterium]|nr:EamA family transporter [Defluviitaleaceae bacterium]